jgi:EEF1A lysine methyltransferase 1
MAANKDDDEDELPRLSATALAALASFYDERAEAEARFAALAAAADDAYAAGTAATVQEDWGLSQFWYDDATADVLARVALAHAPHPGQLIVCVSAPTAFAKIKVWTLVHAGVCWAVC